MRRPLPLPLLLLGLLALVGCERKAPPAPAPASASPAEAGAGGPAPAAGTILLGEVGSLTGSEATFGISARNGIALAIEEANAAGGVKGRKVAVRVYDSQGRPEEAASAVTRLISQDHVLMILGEAASSVSLAMAEKAQAARLPMITPTSTAVEVTAKGDYIFRACFIDAFQGKVMAKFAKENLKLSKVAVLQDNKSTYSIGLADVFVREFKQMGGSIVGHESYSKGDTDFRAQLTALKRGKPEALWVPGYYTDVGLIARQARELGINVPLLGGDGWDSDKLFELGGSSLDGSYFANHYAPENPDPALQRFLAAYKKAYGSVPDSVGALAYDTGRLAIHALTEAKSLTGPALRDVLAQTKDFPGVTGKITFDAQRNPQKQAVVLKVDDGQARFVTTVSP
ncbi:ABC transporter substrate-binding protein [Aggregicoccus sp. 17bor-14]|uniref:ABC transporter substrate-binding protein n=1 Tax=Myxococcaceae TaxID=31 RepID=UPI00129C328E|nr:MULTISPECIES: ABC transporter substrate-binding protein [Myxococcaceae]MBF5043068.1 ABC transporter substrate-binding protein [Simulacricoccus sp. 17bor-14]MRI88831.1 ABC transporter substrate-binding protein [Aggregicoccus sp. 17bor-14]